MIWMGLLSLTAALLPLYLKYRVVWTGERCRGKIVGIAKQEAGYAVGGAAVRKNAYLVKIGQKQYYTAAFFRSWAGGRSGRRSGCSAMSAMAGRYSGARIAGSSFCRWPFWQRRSSFSGWGCRNDLL